LLKPLGYATGQFGKNHLGDRDEHLPSNHGFDEFFGNLYHLNAEEEPENEDYPDYLRGTDLAPRGVLHAFSDGRIEDTGALTRKRMETIDDEATSHAIRFIREAHANDQPFFVWWNTTRMHFRTHIPDSAKGRTGHGAYADAMVLHDDAVGNMLDLLDALGIAEDTIVFYSTDNGPHYNTWPDGGITPWRSEKNSNWEGAYRVPAFVRWPGNFEAGRVLNGIASHQDWLPTLLAAAGENEVSARLKEGAEIDGKRFHVKIDGMNLLPWLLGEDEESPRESFFYVNDDGLIVAIRDGDWKFVFYEQRAKTLALWAEPFVELRFPKIFNLRRDPFERADENSNTYYDWVIDRIFLIGGSQRLVKQQIQDFIDFPPRQKPASFNLDKILELAQAAGSSGAR
jgi:arylsulfatase